MLWSDFGNFWDPWKEFERMRRSIFGDGSVYSYVEFPAVNIWVDGDHALVTAEIAGVDPEEIEVSVIEKSLILRGNRRSEEVKEGETYHRQERWQGSFTKTIDLPFAVESEKVKARFSKGVLSVELPRAEAEKPKKIEVKSV